MVSSLNLRPLLVHERLIGELQVDQVNHYFSTKLRIVIKEYQLSISVNLETGNLFTPTADFVEVRKLAKQIKRRFLRHC